MYLVFVKNEFTLTGNEYFGSDENSIIGYHDPNRATHFLTQKEARKFCKLFDYDNKKIDLVENHIKAFSKCNYVYRKLPKLNPSIDFKYDPSIHTEEDILKWRISCRKSHEKEVSYSSYKTWPELWQHFKHLRSVESYHSKDYKTKMLTVTISTRRDSLFSEFVKEFKRVLDVCSYVDDDGRKLFPIFDHELSEYECRYLVFGGEEDCAITNGRYEKHTGTLEEIFHLMKMCYWYE